MMQLPLVAPTAPQHPRTDNAPRNARVQGPVPGAQRDASFSEAMDHAVATGGVDQARGREQAGTEGTSDDGGTASSAIAGFVPGQGASLLVPAVLAPSVAGPAPATGAGGMAADIAVAGTGASAVPAITPAGPPEAPAGPVAAMPAALAPAAVETGAAQDSVGEATGTAGSGTAEGTSQAASATQGAVAAAPTKTATAETSAGVPSQPAGTNPASPAMDAAPQAAGMQTTPVTPGPAVAIQQAPAPGQPAFTHPGRLTPQLAGPLFTLATAAPGEHVMTLKVSPEALGPMTVRAHIDAAGVRIELFAPLDAGRDALRTILPELRRGLAESGLGAHLNLSQHNSPQDPNPGAGNQTASHRDGDGPHGERGQRDQPGAPRQPALTVTALPGASGPRPHAAVVLSGNRPGALDILA